MSAARNLQLEVVLKAIDKFTAPFKGVLNQSKAVSKQVGELKNKMKDLDKTQGNIDSFKKLSRDTAQSSLQMKAAQERATALGKSLAEAANPTKKMSTEFNRAKKEAAELAAKHTQLVSRQQSLRTSLNAAGVSTRNLSQHQRELRQNATSTTAALQREQQQLERLGRQSQRLHAAKASYEKSISLRDKMAGAGAGMAVAGGGALYAAKQVMAPGLDFDEGMSSVQALTRLDKNSPQLIALRKQARELGAATSFTANEAAQGQGFLAMAGFDPKAIQQAMPGVLDLAKAGRVELPAAADMASNILTGFKLNAEQMGRAGDVLVGTFTRSNVDLRMLAETMKYAAPVAADLGVDLETAAAMTGKLGDAGIQASMAGTGLRAIMSRLAAPPKAAAVAMKELGIQAKDAKGNLRDLPTILAELDAKTKKMGNAQRAGYFKHIAGEEAFSALQVLTAQAGNGKLQELIASLKQSAGEASKNAATMSDNAAGDIKSLQSAWEDVGIEMFEGNNSPLRELIQNITSVIRQVGAWMKANPKLAATIIKISVALAAVVALLGGLTLAAAAVLGPMALLKFSMATLNIQMGIGSTLAKIASFSYGLLAGALGFVSTAVQFLGRALLMNPLGILITLIAVLAVLIYKNWEPLSEFFSELWATIQTKTAAFWLWIKETALQTGNAIADFFLNWSLPGLIYKNWDEIIAWLGGLSGRFSEIGGQIVDGLWQGIAGKWDWLKGKFYELAKMLPEPVQKALDIHSPSRVFAQIGRHTVAGLDQGLMDGKDAPLATIKNITSQIISAASGLIIGGTSLGAMADVKLDQRPPMSVQSSYAPSQAAPIQITINAAPGMDEQKLAQLVAREIAKADRQKQVRSRSRLGDSD
ncbi:phage tail tape measure protein [Iodobacter sp. CM08]|uniref:phage tail tape measure protein n=1 Tax=Iodobacter sp. CM08 TaxID=3085902 RepID=UPI0029821FC3|nr:phage tail tape measure protein [Iodobacter sp. CM08]MDW5418908.1 phage tail tape measure protein [Iodobacter sp. CM08]